jgi:DNA repair protein RadC
MAARAFGESNQTKGNPVDAGGRPKERVTMQFELLKSETPKYRSKTPKEWKLVALRDCPLPENMRICETPQHAAEYWRLHIATTPQFDPERECLVALFLNTRRKIRGHHFITHGTMDTILVHPREVFRVAIVAAAAAIVIMHNHPSGDSTPSESDIKVTRDMIRAGQLLKIDVIDHVIIGSERHLSLRELGYFFT